MVSLIGAVVAAGCGEDMTSGRDGTGRIAPSVDVDSRLLTAEVGSRTEKTVTVDDLSLTLTSDDGSTKRTWASIGEFSSDEQFPIGDYTIEVAYADPLAEGFDCEAAYYDSEKITVSEGRVTPVSLTAVRAQAMVSVQYTDAFKNYLTRAAVDVVSSSGKSTGFVYSSTFEETRSAYIVPGKTTILVGIEKKNGVTAEGLQAAEFIAEAQHHYRVTVDVNEGAVGDAVLTVTFDDSVDAESVDIDLADEVLAAPAPVLTIAGVDDGATVEYVETVYPGAQVLATIIARGGLRSVELATSSAYFIDHCGWPAEVDLMSAETNVLDRLTSHGLDCKGLWNNPDQMAVIDFTAALGEITYFDNDSRDNVSTFTIKVVDKNGKTAEQDLSFSVKVDKLQLALSSPGELKIAGSTMDVTLDYNGIDPKDNIVVSYMNNRGTYNALVVERVEDLGNNQYRLSLSGLPTDDKAVTLKASCGERESDVLVVNRVPGDFSISTAAGDVDVYATRAYISLESTECDPALLAAYATVYSVAADGSKTRLEARQVDGSASLLVTGLEPGVANTLVVSLVGDPDNASDPLTFTTEAATQLPNYGMEDWYSEKAPHSQTLGFGMDAYRWFANAQGDSFWATRNALTTAADSGPTPYYVSYSGTVRVAGASGYAAELSSLGYGVGNTFTVFGGNIKHTAAGMLFIGEHSASSETEESFTYGKPFTSRPFGMSFKYKFAPYNEESFKAYLVVENRDDGVVELARGEIVSDEPASEFTNMIIPLTYGQSSLKATHIYVVFISSTSDSPAVTGVKGANAGYTDAKYIGSVLTIDDIELIY